MANDPINQQQFIEDVAQFSTDENFLNHYKITNQNKLPDMTHLWKLIEESMKDFNTGELNNVLFNAKDNNKLLTMANVESFDYLLFYAMLSILISIFGLFGYKFYKSFSKDIRRKQKLKQKKSKKIKKNN